MAELIDNVEQSDRVEALYEFVTRVQEGADAASIATEYTDAIEAVRPYDVLVIEHTLLAEGASIPAVKEEIEPILAEFRPALEAHDWDQPAAGHPIDNFRRENRAIESHLAEITSLAAEIEGATEPPLQAVGNLQSHIEALSGIDRHFVRKENELFPHLEDHWKHDRPLGVMWSIHDDIRSLRSTLESMASNPETNPATLSTLCTRLSDLLAGLIFKEEQVIFPVAHATLTDAEWEPIQRESAEIGYFEIEPTFTYLDSADPAADTDDFVGSGDTGSLPAGAVEFGLETGSLTLSEVQMLFDTLPIDVTYVDEDDRVRYFNNPEDRIFPRSGSIIGRTVQNCHPPESVDRVEQILSAFRAGEQDRARFWIQNDEAFVVIEYYALRDERGNYRGTLEVTQEASDVRSLEGEKRLVDWGE
ncbi:MAG: DUF438 domain-containing protein [Halobacteriota archaeon]